MSRSLKTFLVIIGIFKGRIFTIEKLVDNILPIWLIRALFVPLSPGSQDLARPGHLILHWRKSQVPPAQPEA